MRSDRPPITSRRPTGPLRWMLRLPIWLYHAHLGWMLGHRMIYIAHRGRRLGFPADPDDPSWPQVAARVHAVTFRPAGPVGADGTRRMEPEDRLPL